MGKMNLQGFLVVKVPDARFLRFVSWSLMLLLLLLLFVIVTASTSISINVKVLILLFNVHDLDNEGFLKRRIIRHISNSILTSTLLILLLVLFLRSQTNSSKLTQKITVEISSQCHLTNSNGFIFLLFVDESMKQPTSFFHARAVLALK